MSFFFSAMKVILNVSCLKVRQFPWMRVSLDGEFQAISSNSCKFIPGKSGDDVIDRCFDNVLDQPPLWYQS